MNPDEMRAAVLNCLTSVAPEADASDVQASVNLREQLDLDSIDLLNFFICLHKRFKSRYPSGTMHNS